MNVTILDKRVDKNPKTGKAKNVLLVLVDVVKYGQVLKQGIEVQIDDVNKYKVGSTIDLDILLPYSEYSYRAR